MFTSTTASSFLPASSGRRKFLQYISYGVGHVQNDLCAAIWFTYLLIFLWNVEGFSPAMAGNLLLLGQIADGIATPFCGFESDEADKLFPICGRYGRRKSWHLGGVIAVTMSFPFIFAGSPGGQSSDDWARAIYLAPIICIFQFGWAATQVAHMSLIPEMTTDESERVVLNSIRYAAQVVANIIAYSIFWLLLGMDSGSSVNAADAEKFRTLSLVCVGIGLLMAILFQFGVKETSKETIKKSSQSQIGGSVKDEFQWKMWFRESQFYVVGFLYMCSRMVFNIGQTYLPLYLTHTLLLDKFYIAILPLIVFIAGFVSSSLIRLLSKMVGVYLTFIVGAMAVAAGSGWMYDVNIGTGIFGAVILLGAGQSILVIVSMAFISDMIGSRTTTAGFVYGFMSTLEKISGGAVVTIIQHMQPQMQASSNGSPKREPMPFFRNIMTCVCGITSAISAILVVVHWFQDYNSISLQPEKDENENEVVPENLVKHGRSAVSLLGAESPIAVAEDVEQLESITSTRRKQHSSNSVISVKSCQSSTSSRNPRLSGRSRNLSILSTTFNETNLMCRDAKSASFLALATSKAETAIPQGSEDGNKEIEVEDGELQSCRF